MLHFGLNWEERKQGAGRGGGSIQAGVPAGVFSPSFSTNQESFV